VANPLAESVVNQQAVSDVSRKPTELSADKHKLCFVSKPKAWSA
jgi:hypothetical protein